MSLELYKHAHIAGVRRAGDGSSHPKPLKEKKRKSRDIITLKIVNFSGVW
jgi:hypothetical protein